MRARRSSGKHPHAIFVGLVSGAYPVLSSIRPAVCLVIADPERHTPLSASGQELRRGAEQLGITYWTARVCLSQIFRKTDTRRQPELIRVLLTTLIPS
jgi:hypothetical protein